MKKPGSKWMTVLSVVATFAVFMAQPLRAEIFEKSKKVGGITVRYKVVLPNGYDPAKAYPAILAFGGGPQTMNTVDSDAEPQLPQPKPRSAATSSSLRPRRTINCSSRTARGSFRSF